MGYGVEGRAAWMGYDGKGERELAMTSDPPNDPMLLFHGPELAACSLFSVLAVVVAIQLQWTE
jgi:hypothetical protein